VNKALELESQGEPPSKKARRLSEKEKESTPQSAAGEDDSQKRLALRKKKDSGKTKKSVDTPSKMREEARTVKKEVQAPSDIESGIEQTSVVEANPDDAVASIDGDADGYGTHCISFDMTADNCRYESPTTQIPAEIQNFPLSKTRLNKNNIVYSDEHKLCVRMKEKMVR